MIRRKKRFSEEQSIRILKVIQPLERGSKYYYFLIARLSLWLVQRFWLGKKHPMTVLP